MFAPKEHIFGVTLQRHDRNTPWGVRIVGGADLGAPILVTRAVAGSPCDGKLMRGDEIKKIGDYDARDIRHQDALNLFQNAGNTIKLDIKRDPGVKISSSLNGSAMTPQSSRPQSALSSIPSRPVTPVTPKNVIFPPPFPYQNETEVYYRDGLHTGFQEDEKYIENVKNQPYRTTPLVLPGAKAKHEKELVSTGSYLRYHPNPMMRAPPSHYEFLPQDVVMKQRVADTILQRIEKEEALAGKQIIHKQFNTPIGLYSDKNIVDTIQHQTGISPGLARTPSFGRTSGQSMGPRKTVVYDPSKSETFKALQEEQFGDGQVHEVTVPAQPKVFTPNKQPPPPQRVAAHQPPQTHTYDPLSQSSVAPHVQHHVPYVNSMGHSEEQIAQSGSFKRLMNMEMSDISYNNPLIPEFVTAPEGFLDPSRGPDYPSCGIETSGWSACIQSPQTSTESLSPSLITTPQTKRKRRTSSTAANRKK